MTDPISFSTSFTQPATQPTQITIHPLPEKEVAQVWSPYQSRKQTAPEIVNDDFFASFADLLDVINPLKHVPVVSTLYSEITGDNTISAGAKIAGGVLFGGPVGLFASIVNSIAQDATGKDIGGNIFAAVTGKYEQTASLAVLNENKEDEQNASLIPPLT